MDAPIIIIVFLFIVLFAINKKRSVFLLCTLSPLLCSVNGIASVSVLNLITIIFIFFLVVKSNSKIKLGIKSYPFWPCAIACFTSLLLTNLFSPGEKHWPATVNEIIFPYFLPLLLWLFIDDESDLKRYLRIHVLFFLVVTVYGMFEALTGVNPLKEIFISTNLMNENYGEAIEYRYGFKRISSFLITGGFLGMYCVLNFLMFNHFLSYHSFFPFKKITTLLFIILAVLVSFFTGSRSVIAAFAVALLYFVDKKTFRNRSFYFFVFLLIIAIPYISPFLNEVVSSFTDTSSVSGSSSDMRLEQLEFSIEEMERNFVFGNGLGYSSIMSEAFHSVIRGVEGIWFSTMMDRGFVGVLTLLFEILFPIFFFIKRKFKIGVIMTLSYYVFKSLTSDPLLPYLMYTIITMKASQFGLLNKMSNNGMTVSTLNIIQ